MPENRTQRITAKDISEGRIRVPNATKRLFSTERTRIQVDLLGHKLDCRWDPKYGPDQERSGVIGVGRAFLADLVRPDERLYIFAADDGIQIRRDAAMLDQPILSRPEPAKSLELPTVDTPAVRSSSSAAHWRQAREEAAAKYKPQHVRLLLVAEAPPSTTDRYFYFPDVGTQDSLFRYVVKLVLGTEPDRVTKPRNLARLKAAGVFLIDLCLEPISGAKELKACVPDLLKRAAGLDPDHIIVIKTGVFDLLRHAMRQVELPLVDARIAFPGSGQQKRFELEMQEALGSINWRLPEETA